jgi:hypothetical protein
VSEIDAPIYAVLLDADGYEDQIIDQADICCNLILFQFAHLSVVEYLMTRTVRSDSSQIPQHSYVEVSPQVTISCLLYLVRREEPHLLARHPILERKFSRRLVWGEAVPVLRNSLLQFTVIYRPTFYHMSRGNQTLSLKGLTGHRERSRTTDLLSSAIYKQQKTLPMLSVLLDLGEVYVDGIASRVFVAAAFGFEQAKISTAQRDRGRNGRNHICSQVARGNFLTK